MTLIHISSEPEDYTLTPKDCKLVKHCSKCGRILTNFNTQELCWICFNK